MKKYTKEFLIKILKELALKLEKTPTSYDVGRRNSVPDRSVFESKFGSWNNALVAAGLKINCYYRKWTRGEIIEWLTCKYKEFGRTPGIRDFDKDPRTPSKSTVRKLFGNWTNALREANIPVRKFHSEKELINIMKKLYLELHRTPTREEINERDDCPSYIPFVENFGSYTAACLRAGLVPNDGRNNNIWKGWQKHCEEMARVVYENIEVKFKNEGIGIPDIYVQNQGLFIDAKTCGYRDFKEQIRRYCSNGHRLEFWCIFKGIETANDKVKYVYAEELSKRMKILGREDLAAKCYQFVRNVFDEGQKVLS